MTVVGAGAAGGPELVVAVGGGGGGGGTVVRTTFADGSDWLDPMVILISRPELELADLLVVRRNPHGDRYAFTDGGWRLVAPGAEAPILARLTLWHCAVPLAELDAALEPVRAQRRREGS